MGIFSGIANFFTGNKTADSVIDGVKRATDMLIFTDEEKSITNQKSMELFIKYQEATLPQNVTRRMIAIVVVALWCLAVLITMLLGGSGILLHIETLSKTSEYYYKFMQDVINVPFGIIVGFYFLKRIVQK